MAKSNTPLARTMEPHEATREYLAYARAKSMALSAAAECARAGDVAFAGELKRWVDEMPAFRGKRMNIRKGHGHDGGEKTETRARERS